MSSAMETAITYPSPNFGSHSATSGSAFDPLTELFSQMSYYPQAAMHQHQAQPYGHVPRRPPNSSAFEANAYGRAFVPSQSGMAGSIPLYPTQSNTAPSQYTATPSAMPLQPSYTYQQGMPSVTSPRTFGHPAYANAYPAVGSIPLRPASTAPMPRSISLASVSNGPDSSDLFGLNESIPSPTLPPLVLADGTAMDTQSGAGSAPVSHRRHPVHPEGMPQPKGRGARKSSKIDDATKTLPCDGCEAMFARKHDLDRHRRIHTLEAPYLCRGCKRSYRRSDARKRHWDQEPTCSVLHARSSSDKASTP